MSNPFQMLGLSGSRDERGLISMAIPWNCGTLSETLSIGGTFPFGLPEVGRAISQLDDGSYQVTINFQGIEDAEGQALVRALGIAAMEMTVIDSRAALIAWYERRGYSRTGETRPFPVLRDPPVTFVVLEKPLGPA